MLASGEAAEPISSVELVRGEDGVSGSVNGEPAFSCPLGAPEARPLGLIAREFSVLTCSRFEAEGEILPCETAYNAYDALLGAASRLSDWEKRGDCLAGGARAKWNVACSSFSLVCERGPELGAFDVYADGVRLAEIDLRADEWAEPSVVYASPRLDFGGHGIEVKAKRGRMSIGKLVAHTIAMKGSERP